MPFLQQYSPGYGYHLMNLMRYYDFDAPTYVISLDQSAEEYKEILNAIYRRFTPHRCVIWRRNGDEQLMTLIPFVKSQIPVDGKTTLYVCQRGVCEAPVNQIQGILDVINNQK